MSFTAAWTFLSPAATSGLASGVLRWSVCGVGVTCELKVHVSMYTSSFFGVSSSPFFCLIGFGSFSVSAFSPYIG